MKGIVVNDPKSEPILGHGGVKISRRSPVSRAAKR